MSKEREEFYLKTVLGVMLALLMLFASLPQFVDTISRDDAVVEIEDITVKDGMDSGTRYDHRLIEDFNNWTNIDRSNTTAAVKTMDSKAYLWGTNPVIPPLYEGTLNINTRSYGFGYSPKHNEYWIPQYNQRTIYRYNRNGQELGSFNSGQDYMWQLWGDMDGTYYTANYRHYKVYKWSEMGDTKLWEYNVGYYAGAVCCDENYVYALRCSSNQMYVLRKTDGGLVRTVNLPQSSWYYGSLAYANGYLYVGNYANDYTQVAIFEVDTMNYVSSFRARENIYMMAFDGEFYLAGTHNTVHKYRISDGNAYLGDDVEPPTNITHIQSKILTKTKETIGAAKLTWYGHTPPGTELEFKLTVDGKNWVTMENNTDHIFEHQGAPLRWNATIKTDDKDISPYIDRIVIEYDLVSRPQPKGPSSAVWHGTSYPTLEWNFTDPDHFDSQSAYIVNIYNDTEMQNMVYNSSWIDAAQRTHAVTEALPDGIYFWRLRTKDSYFAASNYSVLKKFKLDTAKPVGSVVIQDDVETVNEQLVDIEIFAVDSASGVADMQIINDRGKAGPWEPYGTESRMVLESIDGLKTIGVRFRDTAGIVSDVFNDTVYLDLKGPFDVNISSPSHPDPEVYYNNTNPIFEWELPYEETAMKGFSYMIDTSEHTDPGKVLYTPKADQISTAPGEFSGLNDGIWYFHMTPCDIYDQWGNTTHFQFNIDTKAPKVFELGPDNTEWTNGSSIEVSVVMEDAEGYGIDTESIQYSYRTHGGKFSPWIRDLMRSDVKKKTDWGHPKRVEALVDIPLTEGDENAVRWRVSDLSGNGPSRSEVWTLKMDRTPVTFMNPVPADNDTAIDTTVSCGITILDGVGSGVNGKTVQYSVSFSGPEAVNFTEWKSARTNSVGNSISVMHNIAFEPGKDNYVRWRAKDVVGNWYANSDPYRVWVNSAPVPVIHLPRNNAVINIGTPILLNADGTTDNEGDALTYYWEVKNGTTKRVEASISGPEGNITLDGTGRFTIYLYVNDGFGFNETVSTDIHIVTSGGTGGGGGGEGGDEPLQKGNIARKYWPLLVGFVIILLIVTAVMAFVWKRKQNKENKDDIPTPKPFQAPVYRAERPYSVGGHDFYHHGGYSQAGSPQSYPPYIQPGQPGGAPAHTLSGPGFQPGSEGMDYQSPAHGAPGTYLKGEGQDEQVDMHDSRADIQDAEFTSYDAESLETYEDGIQSADHQQEQLAALPSLSSTGTPQFSLPPLAGIGAGLSLAALPPATSDAAGSESPGEVSQEVALEEDAETSARDGVESDRESSQSTAEMSRETSETKGETSARDGVESDRESSQSTVETSRETSETEEAGENIAEMSSKEVSEASVGKDAPETGRSGKPGDESGDTAHEDEHPSDPEVASDEAELSSEDISELDDALKELQMDKW